VIEKATEQVCHTSTEPNDDKSVVQKLCGKKQ